MGHGLRKGLLAWQWSLYQDGHRDRRNLAVHAATVPLFDLGTLAVLLSPALGAVAALAGAAAMATALGLQGRTHRLEGTSPVPFDGPWDAASRLFVEQWITFPRFVLGGAFARQWAAAAPSARVRGGTPEPRP
jgi:hypothetical protein